MIHKWFILTYFVMQLGFVYGQKPIWDSTSCMRLKKPLHDHLKDRDLITTVPISVAQFSSWTNILSRFDEKPLIESDAETFRITTFGSSNELADALVAKN